MPNTARTASQQPQAAESARDERRECAELDHELAMLQGVLDEAVGGLLGVFSAIAAEAPQGEVGRQARQAVVHLQFHDMATQMIARARLRAARLRDPGAAHGELRALASHADRGGDTELF
jgi:hypothetical protein